MYNKKQRRVVGYLIGKNKYGEKTVNYYDINGNLVVSINTNAIFNEYMKKLNEE